jgi:hypothetical protein
LKTVHDILTKIAQRNTQKDKALKHLEGVIRRLQEEEKEPKPKDKEVLERLAAIESHLCELKATKTYVQAAATLPSVPAIVKPALAPEKKQQLEQAKKERSQYEITVTANKAPKETKEALATTNYKDITAKCQDAINKANIEGSPTLKGINKLGKDALRLQFNSIEDAKTVRGTEVNWEEAYPGLAIHKPKYGVVIHGVPTGAIDMDGDYHETIKEWEAENAGRKIKIVKVSPLRRKEKHKLTAHQSIVIFTEDPSAADQCIRLGFFIDNQRLKVEKYAPHLHINQCYKCHGYGHRSIHCKKKDRCGRCGQEGYIAINCNAEKPCCANCNEPHEAWNIICPRRMEEGNKLHQMRLKAPPFFA